MLLWILLSCAAIPRAWQQEKTTVLAPPPPLAERWEPELRLQLSDAALQTLADGAVSGGLLAADTTLKVDGPLGLSASLRPEASVKGIKVKAGDCQGCVDLDISLAGQGVFQVAKLTGDLPFNARLQGTLAFTVTRADSAWAITGQLTDLRGLKVSADRVGQVEVGAALKGWVDAALSRAPAVKLGEIGGLELPLRAARVATRGGALTVEAASDVAGGAPLGAAEPAPDQGWTLSVSQQTALALLRRAAFLKGPIAFDVAVDPRKLSVEGDDFTLDLRLWRLKRPGWWREYQVTGSAAVVKERLKLRPKEAVEGEKSQGAGLADPLALLAEGRILDAVEQGVAQSFPAGKDAKLGEAKLSAAATGVEGRPGALLIRGELTVSGKKR